VARRYTRSRRVERALSIEELRSQARRALPAFVFEYLDGGAEDEVTLRRNREVFDELRFTPRVLEGGGQVDLGVELFGRRHASPLLVAPMGFCGLFAPEGDLKLARAARDAGATYVQSTVSNATLEAVAALGGPRWLQLYVFRDRAFMARLVERAQAAGVEALVVTVDAATFGNREWDRRNYRVGTDPTLANKLETLRHPGWLWRVMRPGVPSFGNLLDVLPPAERSLKGTATWSREQVDPDLDWAFVRWLRGVWRGPLLLKGVLALQDARRAREEGVDGLVLSNHGGRQLDGAVSPIEVLPEIAADVGSQLTLLVDSGLRRGTDVAKALALGARAVLIGRPLAYGLAAGGEAGAARALAILHQELRRTLALLGRPGVERLGPDCLFDGRPASSPQKKLQP
jgi:(S)-mandelate dehydrogenase